MIAAADLRRSTAADRPGEGHRRQLTGAIRSFSTHPNRRPALTRRRLAEMHANEGAITARVEHVLNACGCRIAILSRPGSDLSRYRFEGETPGYTHTGFAVRTREGWLTNQMLNTHGGAEGHIYWQRLIDFFRDDPHEYRCAVLVPSPSLQERLAVTLASPLAERLYTPRYSRVSYPWSTRYQNSNQWVVEILGAAQSCRFTRPEVQRYLADEGMTPSVLRTVGYVFQSLVGFVSSNTRFDDHPVGNRIAGRIEFVTENSIRNFLHRTDRVMAEDTVRVAAQYAPGFDSEWVPAAAA